MDMTPKAVWAIVKSAREAETRRRIHQILDIRSANNAKKEDLEKYIDGLRG